MMSLKQNLIATATQLGFNRIGITPARPSPTLHAYQQWVADAMHGSMGYLARDDRQIRRQDLNVILPNVQTLIIVALDYHSLPFPDDVLQNPLRARISNYAWGADYHDIMTPRLKQLAQWLQSQLNGDVQYKVYVDTGAILERSHAQQADLGFVGKNTMLIHPRRGSYFFLGEILTTYAFASYEYDQPHRESMCGTCTRCLTACPTDAFPQPYVLDARRCISYLTIENKGDIPLQWRSQMRNWVYGCDVCQDVCPWNRFAVKSHETAFFPATLEQVAPLLSDVLQLDEDGFRQRFAQSPLLRIKRERLLRNACVAAGNAAHPTLVPYLKALLSDPSPLIQRHAHWALERSLK